MAFTDAFTRADENLEASANWTRVDGAAGAGAVRSNQFAQLSSTNTAYQCPDQGSADHYSQATTAVSGSWTGFLSIRTTDSNNFIGTRPNGSTIELYKRVSGTFTSLGSAAANTGIGAVYYLEGSGNNLTVKVDSVTKIGPISETALNTVTRSGIVVRTTLNPTLDNFESGTLSSGVSGTISVTLDAFTSSISGTTTVTGTIAQTLANFTSSISGTSEIPGTIAVTLENNTSSISGSVGSDVTGTLAVTLENYSSSMSGTTTVIGTIAVTLAAFTSSISGTTTILGTISSTLEDFIPTINGFVGEATARLRTLLGIGE